MKKAFTEVGLKASGWEEAFQVVGQHLPVLDVGKHRCIFSSKKE